MDNKSPLRYPGGKTRACKIIEAVLKDYTNITRYKFLISPFFGGGSFEFYMQNKYNLDIIANDKFTPLYNFWRMAKEQNAELVEEIKKLKPITKEQFKHYRDNIMDINNPLLQAAWYFAINRSSFSGATLSGGFSVEASEKRFTDSSIKRVQNLDLSRCILMNTDFGSILPPPHCEETLLFMDPPYYLEKGSKLYGKNGDMHENFDHQLLASKLQNAKNWILCYNDCSFIRNLYKNFIIMDVDWSYGMRTGKSSEILILSF